MSFRRVSALSIAALTLASPLGAPLAAPAGAVRLDIPAQDARAALMTLCLKSGCAFALSTEPGRTFRANAVSGVMSWQEAVRRMLEGTGLRYDITDHASVRVWAETSAPRAAPVPEEVVDLEAVTVTAAFVAGIQNSLIQKRRADAIIDAVSAGRIGELPAANLAEALQRVPGVAIEREVGEGQFVSVRGLGPLFQSVTLNGAPVAFNENIRNSSQSGRQFRFRALSADLLAGAVVAKSATADLVDGGIGSNIDIRTVRGLEGPSYLSIRADVHAEARSGAISPDFVISGRWRRPDDQLGVVGGVAMERREVQYDRFQTQRYRDMMVDGQVLAVPDDVRTTVEQEQRARATAFVGVEWRVAPAVSVYLDAMASRFNNSIREDRIVYVIGDYAVSALAAGSARVEDGALAGGRITAGQVSNNLEISDQTHDNVSLSLAMKADAGVWSLEPRLSASSARSNLDTPLQRIGGVSPLGVSYAFDLGADLIGTRKAPLLSTTFDIADPGKLTFSRYGVRATHVEDHDVTGLIAAGRPVDWLLGPLRVERLRLGGQTTDRGRDYQRRDREAALRPGAAVDAGFFDVATPTDAFGRLIVARPPAWTAADFAAFRSAFVLPGEANGVIVDADDLVANGADLQGSYKVAERILAGYGRLDFSMTLLGQPATGNVGIRAARTRTEVVGSLLGISAAGQLEVHPVRYAGSHAVALPSANLAIALDEHWRLRLAASRSITRPSLADLRSATVPASSLVSRLYNLGQAEIDTPSPGTLFAGVGGKPALKPYLATNYDLSLEREFEDFGGASLALFHKAIDDFIVVAARPERLAFATRLGAPVTATVMMSRPRNAGEAKVTGIEAAFSRRLPGGFGVWTSATLVDAGSRADTNARGRLNGVSRLSYSISPFIDRGRLNAHLSWTWRSSFVSEADMQGGGVSSFVIASAGYLDAAGSYNLTPKVSLFVEASNLTDTIEAAYEGRQSRPLQIGRSGRAFGLGIRIRL